MCSRTLIPRTCTGKGNSLSVCIFVLQFYNSEGTTFDAATVYKKAFDEFGEDITTELFAEDADEDTMRRVGVLIFLVN